MLISQMKLVREGVLHQKYMERVKLLEEKEEKAAAMTRSAIQRR